MLALDHVSKTYKVGAFGGKDLIAVRDVTFSVSPGEVVSLIGESGSGKSTIGRMILRLIEVNKGLIKMDGTDVSSLRGAGLRDYYRTVQGVFQDPFSSFNPIFRVSHAFDMLRGVYGQGVPGPEWTRRVGQALDSVGLEGGQVLHKHPHQLSGGQLQRILIARALLLDTRMLVADEIISMLDASTRIDVLNLLGDLKTRGLGILFITHDLSLANYISERAIILRRGRVVEIGPTATVFGRALHPYTQQLLGAVPRLHERWGSDVTTGPAPQACRYHQAVAAGATAGGETGLVEIEAGHLVACANIDGPCPDAALAEAPARA